MTILLCIIFAVLRFALPSAGLNSNDIFKDLAHIFVGTLLGAALCGVRRGGWLFGAMVVVELYAGALSLSKD